MKDKRIFEARLIDSRAKGYIVDLSPPGDTVYPDCYWRFGRRRDAVQFLGLVDSGLPAREALHIVETCQ